MHSVYGIRLGYDFCAFPLAPGLTKFKILILVALSCFIFFLSWNFLIGISSRTRNIGSSLTKGPACFFFI